MGRGVHLSLVLEANLASCHAAIFLEVRPWCVDDSDIVLLVALDRVGLGQLAKIDQELLRDVVPGLALTKPQVNMRAGKLVYVELGML